MELFLIIIKNWTSFWPLIIVQEVEFKIWWNIDAINFILKSI